jgi:putative transcriptional regulator
MAEEELAGRLLVATPSLRDPNFLRTVVLVLEHSPEGALGLVVNRPTETAVDEPLPEWGDHAAPPAVLFVGGPVQPEAAICIARSDAVAGSAGWQPLFDRLGTLDLGCRPADVGAPIDRLRVFAGYAGWGAGQLDGEIAAGAWWVVDAHPGDVLSPSPRSLWREVLHRQPGVLGAIANFPADLSTN